MPDYRLRIGMKFKQQGRIYAIEQALPDDRLGIKDILTGESLAKPRGELLAALFAGKLELIGDGDQSEAMRNHLARLCITDLNQLAEDDPLRMETVRRSHYVNRVAADLSVKWNKEGLAPVIRAVSVDIKDENPPSWITLYRWLRNYQAAGRDVRSLAPAIKLKRESIVITGKVKGGDYVGREVNDSMLKEALVEYLSTAGRMGVLRTGGPLWTRHDHAGSPGEALTSHAFVKNLKRYAREAGVGDVHLHQTRHSFARIVAGSMTETQDALGHRSMATTRVYVQRIAIKKDRYSAHIVRRLR